MLVRSERLPLFKGQGMLVIFDMVLDSELAQCTISGSGLNAFPGRHSIVKAGNLPGWTSHRSRKRGLGCEPRA